MTISTTTTTATHITSSIKNIIATMNVSGFLQQSFLMNHWLNVLIAVHFCDLLDQVLRMLCGYFSLVLIPDLTINHIQQNLNGLSWQGRVLVVEITMIVWLHNDGELVIKIFVIHWRMEQMQTWWWLAGETEMLHTIR